MNILLRHSEKIWVFVKVAECGSVSRAAELLHLSQPTITYAIKTLEQQLGFNLFIRSSRGLVLNTTGRIFFEEAKKAEGILSTLEKRLLRRDTLVAPNKLTIATYESVAVYLWPKLTKKIETLYPQMELALVTKRSSEVIEEVSKGKTDLGLVVGKVEDRELTSIPLYHDYFSFYGSATTRFKAGFKFPVITVPDARDANGVTLESWISMSKFRTHPVITLSSFEVCAEFAAQGIGIAILPNRVYQHQRKAGRRLRKLTGTKLPESSFGKHDFFLCYRAGSPQNDLFKEHFARQLMRM